MAHTDGIGASVHDIEARTETDGVGPSRDIATTVGADKEEIGGIGRKRFEEIGGVISTDVLGILVGDGIGGREDQIPLLSNAGRGPSSIDAVGVGNVVDLEVGDRQTGGSLGHRDGEIAGGTVGDIMRARGCRGSSCNRTGVAIEIAVGSSYTHAVVSQRSGVGNEERGLQSSRIVVGAFANINDLVAIESQVVVPVDPNDGTIIVASAEGDVDISLDTSRQLTYLVEAIVIVWRHSGDVLVDNGVTGTKRDIDDTIVVDRTEGGLTITGKERGNHRSGRVSTTDRLDGEGVVGLGSKVGEIEDRVVDRRGENTSRIGSKGDEPLRLLGARSPSDSGTGGGQFLDTNIADRYAVGQMVDSDVIDINIVGAGRRVHIDNGQIAAVASITVERDFLIFPSRDSAGGDNRNFGEGGNIGRVGHNTHTALARVA